MVPSRGKAVVDRREADRRRTRRLLLRLSVIVAAGLACNHTYEGWRGTPKVPVDDAIAQLKTETDPSKRATLQTMIYRSARNSIGALRSARDSDVDSQCRIDAAIYLNHLQQETTK